MVDAFKLLGWEPYVAECAQQLLFYGLILGAGLVTGKLTGKLFPRKDGGRQIYPPGLPILGQAIALGRLGTMYIRECRKQYGPAFSLRLAGQRMCFLFEPHHIEMFFKAPESEITFRPAVEQFTQRVFGLPSKDFFPKHAQILTDLRHMLTPSTLESHAQQLAHHAEQQMEELFPVAGGSQVELFAAVRKLVFRSAVPVLFGSSFASSSHPGFLDELEEAFVTFESSFEMAASPIPHAFLPRFEWSRAQLLAWFGEAHKKGLFQDTPVGELLQKAGLKDDLAPHLMLALLWASQANTVPATFWAVAMICLPEHREHLQAIRDELLEGVTAADKGAEPASEIEADGDRERGLSSMPFSRLWPAAFKLATNRRSHIARCTAEATRLRVQSLDVRFAAKDLQLNLANGDKVDIPKGCILALCPYEIHHDDALFPPSASTFDPTRAPMNLGDGNAIMPTVAGIAFGAGAYRCPGRFFAEMEVALLVQLILARRNFTFLSRYCSTPSVVQQDGGLWELARTAAVELLGKGIAFWGLGIGSPESSSNSSLPNAGSDGSKNSADSNNTGEREEGPDGSAEASKADQAGLGKADKSCSSSSLPCGSNGSSKGDTTTNNNQNTNNSNNESDTNNNRSSSSSSSSGDPGGRLPTPDHSRLVGVKVPSAPCMVSCTVPKYEEEGFLVL